MVILLCISVKMPQGPSEKRHARFCRAGGLVIEFQCDHVWASSSKETWGRWWNTILGTGLQLVWCVFSNHMWPSSLWISSQTHLKASFEVLHDSVLSILKNVLLYMTGSTLKSGSLSQGWCLNVILQWPMFLGAKNYKGPCSIGPYFWHFRSSSFLGFVGEF